MSPKKILIVVESIDVEDSSGSKANVALIHNLQKTGIKLLVLHYTRKEIQLPNIKCVEIKEKKISINYFLSRIQRKIQHGFRINLAKYLEKKYGFSFTFFNDVESIKNTVVEYKNFNPDLVLTLSKGASFRPHYAVLQYPFIHDKWMAYIHDPYPFHLYPEPYNWSEPGYKKKIEFFEQLSASCKWVAFPSVLLGDWMMSKFPYFEGKEVIIPHQLVEKENAEKENIDEFPEFFNSKKFTLLHAGNLMKQRPPFYLIKAFQDFIKKNPEAEDNSQLLLIGNATYHEPELQKLANDIPQLIVKEYMNFEMVLALQKSVTVNIILESIAEASPFLPGKFPHCIAADKLILHLGPANSEVRRLLGKNYEYYSKSNDTSKIAEKIKDLYFRWKENKDTLKLNRPDLKRYLSKAFLKEQIQNLR